MDNQLIEEITAKRMRKKELRRFGYGKMNCALMCYAILCSPFQSCPPKLKKKSQRHGESSFVHKKTKSEWMNCMIIFGKMLFIKSGTSECIFQHEDFEFVA